MTAVHATASLREVADELERDKGTASRRVKEAIRLGYVSNNEPKLGVSAQLELGEPLPENRQVLPLPDDLRKECCGVAALEGECRVDAPSGSPNAAEDLKCGMQS
jgi:hypothetical protein